MTRSRDDRIVGGVCGGLGRYFNADPLFFRIGAVALAFVGGAGLLLYLAALLLMPADGEAAATVPTEGRNRTLVIAGVVVLLLVWWVVSGEGPSGDARDIARRSALGIGVIIVCGVIGLAGFVVAVVGPDWLVPAFVVAAGVAIATGAFVKPLRWLVLPAVTLALAAGTVAAAGVEADGSIGEREYRPGSGAELRERYELGVGELVVDLRETDLPAGDVPLEVDVGVGEARVIVPDDVCVATDAEVGMGQVTIFGIGNGGVDVDVEDVPSADPTTTRLLLKADVGFGALRVHDSRGEFFGGNFGPPFDDVDLAAAQRDVCASAGERASG